MIEDVSMNLMICDDQKSELENMRQIVSEYALTHTELSLAVKCFVNPFDMLDEIDKSGAPDIALLDICMPGILGTEVAREILGKSTEDTDIIFLTTSPDFAVEAFALHAGDYLTKPYAKQRLTDTLDRVIEKRRRQNNRSTMVPETEYFPVLFVSSLAIRQYCCVLRLPKRKNLLVSGRRFSANSVF